MTRITIALAAALAAAACVDTEPTAEPTTGSIDLTFEQATVHATGDGDQTIAEVAVDGDVQATLDWDNRRGAGVLDDLAGQRSERIALDQPTPLPLAAVGEMAYRSWVEQGGSSLRYGDCYWIGTQSAGIECCWGNKGWDCIVWK